MRTANPIIVLGPDGRPLAGAKVHTVIRGSGADATVYANETGATAGSNPATTNAEGRVVQWLERGAYTSVVTAEGMETYDEPWDSAPGSDGAIDAKWLGSALVGFEPGDLKFTARNLLDSGFLKAEGQEYDPVDNPNLYAAIGNRFGGTFAKPLLPDYRERVPVGAGSILALGAKGGEATHRLKAKESGVGKHTHTQNPHTHLQVEHTHGASGNQYILLEGAGSAQFASGGSQNFGSGSTTQGAIATNQNATATNNNTEAEAEEAHNNMQPYTVCNVWIKT